MSKIERKPLFWVGIISADFTFSEEIGVIDELSIRPTSHPVENHVEVQFAYAFSKKRGKECKHLCEKGFFFAYRKGIPFPVGGGIAKLRLPFNYGRSP